MSIDSLIDKWEDPKKPVSEKIRDRIKNIWKLFITLPLHITI